MLKFIDNFLNRTTMYRLVLYYLIVLVIAAVVFGLFGMMPFNLLNFLLTIFIILTVCWLTNRLFAKVFQVPINVESIYITALILVLIITPPRFENYVADLLFLFWVAVWAMASKYICAVYRKHFFNPAAFAVALMLFTIGQPASWWIGNLYMLPVVFIGGVLIVRKIRRTDLVASFLIVALVSMIIPSWIKGTAIVVSMIQVLVYSPLLFFAFVMITEPLTTPPTRNKRILYGGLVGILFTPAAHIGSIYLTPELALLIGNLFSFFVSPKGRQLFTIKEKMQLAPSVYDLVFNVERKFAFQAGQYLEWTLGHQHPDNRGNRRYFTIASSPTETDVRLGVKFYSNPSSFKKKLFDLNIGDEVVATQLAGEFVLPKDAKQKLVFIAGGIGITPFRSMIKYLIDKKENRSIVLFYSNNVVSDIVYSDIFKQAEPLGVKTVYALTDLKQAPESWNGHRGFVNDQLIAKEVPDYLDRLFYISGPPVMVSAFVKMLKKMGVPKSQIKTDFFPGLV